MATDQLVLVLFSLSILTGWGQPPSAGTVLVPSDQGIIGYGIARNPSIAKQRALEDASANRFLSVRFETFMQGMGYAYSFEEFAIEDPASPEQVSIVDSTRREDGLIHLMVAYLDTSTVVRSPDEVLIVRGAYRSIRGDEYRAYALAKRRAVQTMVEARFKSVKVMDQMNMDRMERVAYLSTKGIVRNIRVVEVNHRTDSTVVKIAIHPKDVSFYE